jgi:hypothetical protein
MSKLPNFEDDQQAMVWFDLHDTSEYMDEMEPVFERVAAVRTQFPVSPADACVRTDKDSRL